MTLAVGSLFAGIGGFDLGLERTGHFEVKWQVEIDPWCRRVLEKHWPTVRRWDDVTTFPPDTSGTGRIEGSGKQGNEKGEGIGRRESERGAETLE